MVYNTHIQSMSFLRAPTCRVCIQRLISGVTQQIREKSKVTKVATIPVRLLVDIPKFGRKGVVVPVARGKMRSRWYPQRMADYMTLAALSQLSTSEPVQRDITFRPDLEQAPKEIDLHLLKPAHTVSLLESYLPPTLQFSRPTISPLDNTIHGSISTADISIAVKAIAGAKGTEGSRIVVAPSMVRFLDESIEGDKVKTLGEHKFEIRLKGNTKPVVRSVVIAQQISLD